MLKDEQNNNLKIIDWIQGQEICTLLRFYEEIVKSIIGPKVLVIGTFRILRPNIFFGFVWLFGTSFSGLFGIK